MSGDEKSLTRRPAEYLFPRHSPPAARLGLDTDQLRRVLDQLVGRRLTGYKFEDTMLHLEFEGGVWLRYSDILEK